MNPSVCSHKVLDVTCNHGCADCGVVHPPASLYPSDSCMLGSVSTAASEVVPLGGADNHRMI
jgi:hypothetical protein